MKRISGIHAIFLAIVVLITTMSPKALGAEIGATVLQYVILAVKQIPELAYES